MPRVSNVLADRAPVATRTSGTSAKRAQAEFLAGTIAFEGADIDSAAQFYAEATDLYQRVQDLPQRGCSW